MQSGSQPIVMAFLVLLLAVTTLCGSAWGEENRTAQSKPSTERPNIVFVFTDDQAPWALGASGNKQAHTPNMDQLAKEGSYLTNSFTVTPVCSPSRASLMTSRYGSELGITDWLKQPAEPNLGIASELLCWPEVLQKSGYKTALIGKWHLGTLDKYHPTQHGFDYFMGMRSGGAAPVNPTLEKDGKTKKFKGYTADVLTDDAIEFLKSNQEKPFLLCLHFRAPHARWLPVAEEDWAPFESMDPEIPNPDYPELDVARVKKMTREYLASTASVDRNLGKLRKTLSELKLAENTVIIFTSDHGYNMGHNGIWHKGNGHWVLKKPTKTKGNIPRNQRPNMYDHSIRVPTIVHWPGETQPGSVIDQTVSNLDWYPTILSIAGCKIPKDQKLKGRDFTPLLKSQNVQWDNDLYAEYSTKHQSKTHMRMFRTPKWKLVLDFLNPDRHELFDLVNDPAESNNLYWKESVQIVQIRESLTAKIRKQMAVNSDPVLKAPFFKDGDKK